MVLKQKTVTFQLAHWTTSKSTLSYVGPLKVSGSMISLIFLIERLIFDWCVIWTGSQNKHHKDRCLKRDWIVPSRLY